MCRLIDLNSVEDCDAALSFDSPSSSPLSLSPSASSARALGSSSLPSSSSSISSVCVELLHACAGPAISLPRKGSVVVYLPQGHLEHVSDFPATTCNLPPHVFCRVLDVKLHAEAATDEVYAQVFLVPDAQIEQKWMRGEFEVEIEDDVEGAVKSTTPHMFCKTLTASDTSTHGGFSVPRRAAEDCFPPLDYKQQRPSQELVAKDLHGIEWKFRHIYRGQPRRHLLTTGWSAFVNKKKLVSGDAVLFLRGEDGELRLGVRRAAQFRKSASVPALSSGKLNFSSISAVVDAISTGQMFNISYNPRYFRSSFSVGMRFKLCFEVEDSTERRYTGLVTSVGDIDPIRWPGSKWGSISVRWDDLETIGLDRVSPWDIEPISSVTVSNSFASPGPKRTRVGLHFTKQEVIPRDGIRVLDSEESLKFHKVLQGQEILGFNSPYDDGNVHNHQPSEIRKHNPLSISSRISVIGTGVRNLREEAALSKEFIDFGESFRSKRVLQGQETISNSAYERGSLAKKAQECWGHGTTNYARAPSSRSRWSAMIQGYNNVRPSAPSVPTSLPSSVSLFQQVCTPHPNFHGSYSINQDKDYNVSNQTCYDISGTYFRKLTSSSLLAHDSRENDQQCVNSFGISEEGSQLGLSCSTYPTHSSWRGSQDLVSLCKSSCRLFGFPLTEARNSINKDLNQVQVSSPYKPGNSLLPHGEEHLHAKPPFMTKINGSNCTNVSCLYAFDRCVSWHWLGSVLTLRWDLQSRWSR
ncbi:hypothetical protein NMG60_11012785 [Bertholletia excelsa]